MTAPVELVRAFYAKLAEGDVPGLLGLLHPQLEWTEAEGFPYYSGTWRSPEEVLQKLLIPLMRDWDGFSALAHDYIAEEDRVVSLGAYDGTSKATGKRMHAAFAHVWRIADGRLKSFDMYADTHLVRAALDV